VSAHPPPSIGFLCTGYGGLDPAVIAVLGGDLAWVADNAAAAKLLAARFPGVANLGDITTVDRHTVAHAREARLPLLGVCAARVGRAASRSTSS
jgi:hypothetical protein